MESKSVFLVAYLPAAQVALVERRAIVARLAGTTDPDLARAVAFSERELASERSLADETASRATALARERGVALPALGEARAADDAWYEEAVAAMRPELDGLAKVLAWEMGRTAAKIHVAIAALAQVAYLRCWGTLELSLLAEVAQRRSELDVALATFDALAARLAIPNAVALGRSIRRRADAVDLAAATSDGYEALSKLARDVTASIEQNNAFGFDLPSPLGATDEAEPAAADARGSANMPSPIAAGTSSEDALSLRHILGEVSFAFASRGYAQEKSLWWVRAANGAATTDDDALVALADAFDAFAAEIDAAREAAFAPIAERLRATYEPLDDPTRVARWAREHQAWIARPAEADARIANLEREAGLSGEAPERTPERLARDELLSRARLLRNRAELARARRRAPRARDAVLEAAIAAAPDDESSYLVYADWLQERGDPRGELIALQASRPIAGRIEQFVSEHEADLLGELSVHPERVRALEWHLGFVRHAWLTLPRSDAEREVDLVSKLLAHPTSRFLRSLKLSGPLDQESDLTPLFGDERLALVDRLAFFRVTVPWGALLESPLLRRLRVLDLSENTPVTEAEAEQLIEASARLAHLEGLEICAIHLGADVLARLKERCPMTGTALGDEAWARTLRVLERFVAELSPPQEEARPFFAPSAGQALADIDIALRRRNQT